MKPRGVVPNKEFSMDLVFQVFLGVVDADGCFFRSFIMRSQFIKVR